MQKWIQESLRAPSVYVAAGLILTCGLALSGLEALGLLRISLKSAPQGPTHQLLQFDYRNIEVYAWSALILFPITLAGAIYKASKTSDWKYVFLLVASGLIWLFTFKL